MFHEYLKEHNLKCTPYINRLFSFIYYIECVRLCIRNMSIKEYLNEIQIEGTKNILIGCVAGLSQVGEALIKRLGEGSNIEPNMNCYYNGTIEKVIERGEK